MGPAVSGRRSPPTTSTRPSRSSAAACLDREPLSRLGAALQAPGAGSYSSAAAGDTPAASVPPATSTLPDASSVAVWPNWRATLMLPVDCHDPTGVGVGVLAMVVKEEPAWARLKAASWLRTLNETVVPGLRPVSVTECAVTSS